MRNLVKTFLIILLMASLAQGALRTYTDAGDGLWSTAANWDTGVPVNGDTFAMGVGETVEFDVDQSGFAAGMGASTIAAGTSVVCSTTAGTYHMKMNGDLILAGTDCLQAGTDTSTTLPAGVDFTIEFNSGAFSIEGNGAGSMKLYCVEPTRKWTRISTGGEAAGQTVLSVDNDLTADTWAVGDEIAIIDSVVSITEDVERRTIGAIAATTITVTAGLTNAKIAGAYVCLLNRNITISGSTTYAVDDCDGSDVYAFIDGPSGIVSSNNINVGGAIYTTSNYGIYVCYEGVYLDCVIIDDGLASDDGMQACEQITATSDTLIGGYYYAIQSGKNVVFDGVIAGCRIGVYSAINAIFNGPVWGCNIAYDTCMDTFITGDITVTGDAVYRGTGGMVISNCEINADLDCLSEIGSAVLYNVLFTPGASEFDGYDDSTRMGRNIVVSYNHDQVENAEKGWPRGGYYVSSTAAPLPTGETIKYIFTAEDTTQTYSVFREFKTDVQPGTALEVEAYLAIPNGEDMTGYAPKLQFIDAFDDTLVDSTATVLDEDEIPDPDGSETGFQTVSCIYANTGESPKTVYVRILVQHDGGGNDVIIYGAWSIADYKDQINTLYTTLIPVKTDVATADTTTSFTLTGGTATADIYNNMTVMVQDADDDHWELRSIDDWTAGKVITVTSAFGFTPAQDDLVYIMGTAYGAPVDTASIADAVWDETSTGHVSAGKAGEQLWTDIDAILTDTGTTIPALITATGPETHTCDSNSTTTGNVVSGAHTDAHTDNGTYVQIAPVTPAVGGFGLNTTHVFTIGVGRLPSAVNVNGYFNAAPPNTDDRAVEIWAYNYTLTEWEQISDSHIHMHDESGDQDYQWTLGPGQYQVSDGEVQIRFTSTSTDTDDDLYLDYIVLSSVAQAAAGLTADAITEAVWRYVLDDPDELTTAYALDKTRTLVTDVATGSSTTSFTLDDGIAVNDALNGMLIMVEDSDDDHYEVRRIKDWTSGKVVTVDRAFGFTPAADDDVYIMATGYAVPEVDTIIDYILELLDRVF